MFYLGVRSETHLTRARCLLPCLAKKGSYRSVAFFLIGVSAM